MAKDGKTDKGAKTRRGGKLKLVLPVLLLLGAGLAARSLLVGGASAETEQKPEEQQGTIVTMDPLTVNLADDGFHYAQAGVAIVLTTVANAQEIEERLPLFKDAAIRVIGGFESRELKTLKGQEALRHRLTQAAREVYGYEAIFEVVLTQIVVQ